MNQHYRNKLMWVLYGLLFLAVMLVQTIVFGRLRFFGVKLSLIPVAIVCISLWTGHEAGGLFSLIASFIWYASGAVDGPLSIVTLTVSGILAGYLCSNLFSRRFLSALLLCVGALLFHETILFLFKFYLGAAPLKLGLWVPITVALSALACPILYLLAKAIGKVGGCV